MGFIYNDRNQINLLGYSLDEFAPQDAKCRFVVKLIDRLDLSELYNRYSNQGADAFDPATMLATWFFGYCERQTSTRKLEDACKRDLHFIYVSANLQPDHSSLSRFRKDNIDLIADYFVQLVRLGLAENISDFKEISIDGSKIQASGSPKQNKTSDSLTQQLAAIRQQIDDYMQRCDIAEANEMEEYDVESVRKKIAELQQLEQKLQQRQQQLEQRKQDIKPEYRDDHKINITEPDAYIMSEVNGDQKLPAYNAQIGVDKTTQFIVSNDVVQDRNDKNQFANQHQQTERNLGTDSSRRHNMDSGYHCLEQLEYIYEHQIDAVINDPHAEHRATNFCPTTVESLLNEGRKLQKSDFEFHAEENYYQCPAKKKLELYKTNYSGNSTYRVYRCKDCHSCPLRSQCMDLKRNKSGLRNIRRDDREIYAEQMSNKLKTNDAKERLKTRSTTVEPVFGNLKENLGFRRFRLRGLKKVKGEFNYMCIAHNINIIYKLLGSSLIESIAKVKATFNSSLNNFKLLFDCIFSKLFPPTLSRFGARGGFCHSATA